MIIFSERLTVFNGSLVRASTAVEETRLQEGFGGGIEVVYALVDVAEIED